MKIVVLDGYAANPNDLSWEPVSSLGALTVYDRTAPGDVIIRIGDAEAVLTNKVPITEEIMSACPSLRYIGVLATGYNIIDLEAAGKHKITVTNIPGYSTDAVAQLTIALLLEICHHVGAHSQAVHSGRWEHNPDFCFWDYPLIELAGKTMGIIGYGKIGRQTAKIAKTLGMRILAYGTHNQTPDGVCEFVTLDTLLASSDVISLHCPLFPDTKEIICAESIAKMKNGVIILNTGRGPLIAERDLADALKTGKVYAAAMDVVSKEPIAADNPLLSAPNCIITPHIAWATKEARTRLMQITADNLRAFIEGKPIHTV